MINFQYKPLLATLVSAAFLSFLHTNASAQMVANDDSFSLQLGESLVVESPGILDNDLLHEESAPESGAIAVLVTDVLHGSLNLVEDGSFTYSPDGTFDGIDSFTYPPYWIRIPMRPRCIFRPAPMGRMSFSAGRKRLG